MWGPSLIYEYRPTEFTRHAQWQCCHHRHFVKDSHNIGLIICTHDSCVSITSWQHDLTLYDASAPHKSFSYYYFNYFRHVPMLQKYAGLLWGPLFVGAPVRPNMLNMPKSASGCLARWWHCRSVLVNKTTDAEFGESKLNQMTFNVQSSESSETQQDTDVRFVHTNTNTILTAMCHTSPSNHIFFVAVYHNFNLFSNKSILAVKNE